MGERPIALELDEIRHLLAGGHTTTRLPLTPRTTIVDGETMYRSPLDGLDLAAAWVYPRLLIGAVLWVREPWLVPESGGSAAWYAADGATARGDGTTGGLRVLRPAGTMPRELSRLTVRVESITPDRALGWAWLLRLVRVT